MGTSVQATCECGFNEDFSIGGGFVGNQFLFPCLCRHCKRIVEANLLNKRVVCPKCRRKNIVPYDQAELVQQENGEVVESWCERKLTQENGEVVESWCERKLTDDPHYCPLCDSFRLRFSKSKIQIMWD